MGSKYNAVELENLIFQKSLIRGYKEYHVDSVLDDIIEDYREYDSKISDLESKVALLSEKVNNYEGMESSMKDAIKIAQKAAEDVRKLAEEKANSIVQSAELKAEKMILAANEEVLKTKLELESIKSELSRFFAEVDKLKRLSGVFSFTGVEQE